LFTIIVYAVYILTNFLTDFYKNYVKTDQCSFVWNLEILVYYFFDIFIGYLPYFIWSKFKLFFVYDIVNELRYGKYKYKIDKKKFKKKLKQANKLKKLILKFQNMYEKEDNLNDIKNNNVMDKQIAELVKKYKKVQEEIQNQDHISVNEEEETQKINEDNKIEKNVNNAIVFDYPEFLDDNNLNNKDVITESSVEEEDQEEIFGFISDVSENKESHNDNSTTNNSIFICKL
jgi:hypothetical protein